MKEYAALPLRIVLGIIFLVHGYLKLFGGIEGTTGFFSSIGIPAAGFFAYVVGIVEFLGGIALILGVFMKIFASLLVVDMFVATLLVHIPQGFLVTPGSIGYEFTLTLLAGLVTLLLLGPGKLSLQKAFKK